MRAGLVVCHQQTHVDGLGTGGVGHVLQQRGHSGLGPGVGLRGRAIGVHGGHHGEALGTERSHGQVDLVQRSASGDLAFFVGHFGLHVHRRCTLTLCSDLQRRTDLVDHHRGHLVHGVVGAEGAVAGADVGAEQVLLSVRAGAADGLVLGLHAVEVDVGGGARALGAEGVGLGGSESGRGAQRSQGGECEGVQGTGDGIGSCKTKKQWMKIESRRVPALHRNAYVHLVSSSNSYPR